MVRWTTRRSSSCLIPVRPFAVTRLAKHRRLAHLYVLVGTLCTSAVLFLGAFFVTRSNPDSRGGNALKFAMWGLAITIEVLAYFYASRNP